MKYLYVKNWRKNQSYRSDRGTPPWIKIHRNLMSNARWACLSDVEKGHLVSIWIVAAEREGRVPADPGLLRKICLLDNVPNLKRFCELGFLEDRQDDASLTPPRRQDDVREEEEEEETEEDTEEEEEKKVRGKNKQAFFNACRQAGCFDEAMDWLSVLQKKKAAMTELAWSRRLAKLQRLAEHEPPADILSRSADSGWSDLYSRKEQKNGNKETAVQRRQREAREAIGS